MTWQEIEAAANGNMRAVNGGYTSARRGIVAVKNADVFVKFAVDEQTDEWLQSELKAYRWLHEHDYPFAPHVVAEGPHGFALPDLSAWDWSPHWTAAKLDAALRAMDALTELSAAARGVFPENKFTEGSDEASPWNEGSGIPATLSAYRSAASEALLAELASLVHDKALRKTYSDLAAVHPWRGDDLVHYDVRSDNFAYDSANDRGLLVDWNWLCFGNKKLDQTALMVDVQLAGFEVLPRYEARCDKNSLAWLAGNWLKSAAKDAGSETMHRLRRRQLESALVSHKLLRAL